jgi:hypothetical protein
VAALASDFYVFFAGVFAGLSAVFLAGLDIALTWDVSALFVFFRPHFFLSFSFDSSFDFLRETLLLPRFLSIQVSKTFFQLLDSPDAKRVA